MKTPWYRRVVWWELLAGITLIVLGTISLFRPSLAVKGLVYAYGIAGVIAGVADILLYIRVERFYRIWTHCFPGFRGLKRHVRRGDPG